MGGELGWSIDMSLAMADVVRIADGDVVKFRFGPPLGAVSDWGTLALQASSGLLDDVRSLLEHHLLQAQWAGPGCFGSGR